jgi:rubrerythrin
LELNVHQKLWQKHSKTAIFPQFLEDFLDIAPQFLEISDLFILFSKTKDDSRRRLLLLGRHSESRTLFYALHQTKLLQLLVVRETDYYVCTVCGHIHEREPPEKCPICGASKDAFENIP